MTKEFYTDKAKLIRSVSYCPDNHNLYLIKPYTLQVKFLDKSVKIFEIYICESCRKPYWDYELKFVDIELKNIDIKLDTALEEEWFDFKEKLPKPNEIIRCTHLSSVIDFKICGIFVGIDAWGAGIIIPGQGYSRVFGFQQWQPTDLKVSDLPIGNGELFTKNDFLTSGEEKNVKNN